MLFDLPSFYRRLDSIEIAARASLILIGIRNPPEIQGESTRSYVKTFQRCSIRAISARRVALRFFIVFAIQCRHMVSSDQRSS
jgi:hypothetical protein